MHSQGRYVGTSPGCCISIPMIFVIDLNSLQFAEIGSTPDVTLQVGLYTEPYLFNPDTLLNLDMDISVNRVVKRGSVSGEFRRTGHGRP